MFTKIYSRYYKKLNGIPRSAAGADSKILKINLILH